MQAKNKKNKRKAIAGKNFFKAGKSHMELNNMQVTCLNTNLLSKILQWQALNECIGASKYLTKRSPLLKGIFVYLRRLVIQFHLFHRTTDALALQRIGLVFFFWIQRTLSGF